MVSPTCENSNRNRVLVIDPGFRFLKVLSDLGISVKDIETCLISHNHPDHLGGAYEYIASRHVAREDSKFICNPGAYSMFESYRQKGIEIQAIGTHQALISCSVHEHKKCDITLDSFDTDHTELGSHDESKGLVLNFNDYDPLRKVVILGDTCFEIPNHRDQFVPKLADIHNKVVVLHIGSAQIKRRVGGHLYLQGVHKLIDLIGAELESTQRSISDKLIVLISEWGLEHATGQQLSELGVTVEKGWNNSVIIEITSFLNESLKDKGYDERMQVIPADIGLMVGIRSGDIYWKDGAILRNASPDQLKWRTNSLGLEYYV